MLLLPATFISPFPCLASDLTGHRPHVLDLLASRQVCAPFTIALRHLSSRQGGLETRLIVPHVDLAITSRDFQTLMDVIHITGLSPVCARSPAVSCLALCCCRVDCNSADGARSMAKIYACWVGLADMLLQLLGGSCSGNDIADASY